MSSLNSNKDSKVSLVDGMSARDKAGDAALVEKINGGDKASFRELFVAYYESLCIFAFRFTARDDISEEIVQEVFLNIWESRADWHPDNINAWLYRATRNRALDHIKHEKVKEKHLENVQDLYESGGTPDNELHSRNFESAAQKAVSELPERCRTTFILHRQSGLTYSEIADSMDVSVKTVETQMSRALQLLRSKLQHFLPIAIIITAAIDILFR